ncbi:hypothetical protein E2C01_044941 [Portunus trituberculatus]|uniref:Uncharacterized protein n=1 Tax=Portunus trituberculatus TaxID=210409 RepID=A0A5B7FWX4_PORTR|nr:hypothetical protein [Portunus trituberculatus]
METRHGTQGVNAFSVFFFHDRKCFNYWNAFLP